MKYEWKSRIMKNGIDRVVLSSRVLRVGCRHGLRTVRQRGWINRGGSERISPPRPKHSHSPVPRRPLWYRGLSLATNDITRIENYLQRFLCRLPDCTHSLKFELIVNMNWPGFYHEIPLHVDMPSNYFNRKIVSRWRLLIVSVPSTKLLTRIAFANVYFP